ncbi:MAG: type II toxin-antitoxin system RelE/ParE family toxin [Ottowia sp.]|nr:type II toxin-antitoxin system RelE/ParE family toxin [Ottowia sp.]
MNYAVFWTARARREVDAIAAFIAEDNPRAARATKQKIERSTEILKTNPRFYRQSWYMPECRDIVVDSYLLIYEVFDDAREVHILRAFHGARDIAALLL